MKTRTQVHYIYIHIYIGCIFLQIYCFYGNCLNKNKKTQLRVASACVVCSIATVASTDWPQIVTNCRALETVFEISEWMCFLFLSCLRNVAEAQLILCAYKRSYCIHISHTNTQTKMFINNHSTTFTCCRR